MVKRRRRIRRGYNLRGLFYPVTKILQIALRAVIRNFHIIVIGIILVFIAKGIHNILLNSDYFKVKEVQMLRMGEGGSSIVDSGMSLQLEEGINIFKLNLKKCQRQIEEAHPEIKNVKVNRVLPDKIVVNFQKRIPICQVKSTRYYLVTKDAVVLPGPKNYPQAELPVVTGVYISEKQLPANRRLDTGSIYRAIRLIRQVKQTDFDEKYKVEAIDVYDEFNPIICLENGIRIKIGRRSFIKREPALNKVLQDLKEKGLRPKYIDLRFDDIVVTPR